MITCSHRNPIVALSLVLLASVVPKPASSVGFRTHAALGQSAKLRSKDAEVEMNKYLILSLPGMRQVVYAKLPDTVIRVLILQGLVSPKEIAVDQVNSRLFVSDAPSMKIFWYQLIASPDGKLLTDGIQHVAVDKVAASWLAVDGSGNLFWSGKELLPPGYVTTEAVFKHSYDKIAWNDPLNSEKLWTRENTGPSPRPSRVWLPSGLAVDSSSLFWGNSEKGKEHGSIVLATTSPPGVEPEKIPKLIADNADEVRSLVLTPKFLFYTSGDNSVYGVSREKTPGSCGDADCKAIIKDLGDPKGMAFDGDGTVYVVDAGKVSDDGQTAPGAVLSFPSGSLAEHSYKTVVRISNAFDVDTFSTPATPKGAFTSFFSIFQP